MADPHDTEGGKRTIQINVKMNESEFLMMQQAAARLWPDAILSKSAIVLGLALMAARKSIPVK
jgi:hypothetical protein